MKRRMKIHRHDPETTLEITPDGRIHGLWTDALALPQLGHCLVQRVSYVEFSLHRQCWCVREAQPGGPAHLLPSGNPLRHHLDAVRAGAAHRPR